MELCLFSSKQEGCEESLATQMISAGHKSQVATLQMLIQLTTSACEVESERSSHKVNATRIGECQKYSYKRAAVSKLVSPNCGRQNNVSHVS